jgi:hypothetical protein
MDDCRRRKHTVGEAHAFYAFQSANQAKMGTKVASTRENLRRALLYRVFSFRLSARPQAFLSPSTAFPQRRRSPDRGDRLDALRAPHYACEIDDRPRVTAMQLTVDSSAGTGRRVHRASGWLAAAMVLLCVAGAGAQAPFAPTLYRIFLKSGTPLVSWGEFARVGDRVAFTLPLGDPNRPDTLQMVSLPSDVIDWDRTNLYADTVRYRQYGQTRGESDYKALTDELARALTSIAFTSDPAARLAEAESARRRLLEWPAQHFGYRASEVRDLVAVIDETIAGIRADAGERHFSIDLVASVAPPTASLMDGPTSRESIELAAELVRSTDVPADRLSLQAAILATLARSQSRLGSDWVKATRSRLLEDVRAAERIDHRYADLASRAVSDARQRAARADVKGVERLLAAVRVKDKRFGSRRRAEMVTLVGTIEAQLESARQRRLDLDRWTYRTETYRAYRAGIENMLKRLTDVTRTAEAVSAMSGPDLRSLSTAERRLREAGLMATFLSPPEALGATHDTLMSAVRLMQAALATRRTAMQTSDLEAARNASAAAAGALLLVARARDQINAYFAPPIVK